MSDSVNAPREDDAPELALELILDDAPEQVDSDRADEIIDTTVNAENNDENEAEVDIQRPVARVIVVPYDNPSEEVAAHSAKANKAMHVTQAVIVCVLGSAVVLTAAVTLLMGVMAQ